jgi:hypothetical protein
MPGSILHLQALGTFAQGWFVWNVAALSMAFYVQIWLCLFNCAYSMLHGPLNVHEWRQSAGFPDG